MEAEDEWRGAGAGGGGATPCRRGTAIVDPGLARGGRIKRGRSEPGSGLKKIVLEAVIHRIAKMMGTAVRKVLRR